MASGLEGKNREKSRVTAGFGSDITVLIDTWLIQPYLSSKLNT